MQPFTDFVTRVDECLILDVDDSRFLVYQHPHQPLGRHFWVPFSSLSFPFRSNIEGSVGKTLDLLLRTETLCAITPANRG